MIDVTAVQKNIFPGAHEAIWQAFPWHDGAATSHSQALAVSVFGTLATHRSKQALIDEMVRAMFGGEPSRDGEWQVSLEVKVPRELLGERRRTQADVLLQNETSVVLLECKFAEAGGGSCSQPKPLSSGKHAGLRQCKGKYKMQTNPVNGKEARCALSAKGIRYWKYIPKYFDWANDKDHVPCPFAGPAYQYMRNALAAARWARQHKLKRAAFGLIYAAGEQFPMSGEVADPNSEWNTFIRHLRVEAALTIKAISYQHLLETWGQCLPQDKVLTDFANWVEEKIQAVQQIA